MDKKNSTKDHTLSDGELLNDDHKTHKDHTHHDHKQISQKMMNICIVKLMRE